MHPRYFYGFLILNTLLWTILPALTRHSVPHDAIEAFVWAQSLDFGYDKNPYLIGWITRLGLWLCGYSKTAWGYYFIQQCFIALGLWSVWKLGIEIFRDTGRAAIASLVMLACPYYSAYVQINNDNFILLGLWPLSTYAFYLALNRAQLRFWILTATALGLAVMAKYSAVIFLLPLSISLLIFSRPPASAIATARQPGYNNTKIIFNFLTALVIFIATCCPNIYWLYQHDFLAIKYVFVRTDAEHQYWLPSQLYFPLNFVYLTLVNLSGCFILFWISKCTKHSCEDGNAFSKKYIYITSLLPLAYIVIMAFIFDWQLYWEWGVPFTPLLGLAMVMFFHGSSNSPNITRFNLGLLILMLLTACCYLSINFKFEIGEGSADYPAQEIANYVDQIWHEHSKQPLKYVAGSRYTAGYIGFYSKDKPKVYAEWNDDYSPGVDDEDIRQHGAIFIQDGYYGTRVIANIPGYHSKYVFPDSILKRYPNLIVLPFKTFFYHNGYRKVPVLIGVLMPRD